MEAWKRIAVSERAAENSRPTLSKWDLVKHMKGCRSKEREIWEKAHTLTQSKD